MPDRSAKALTLQFWLGILLSILPAAAPEALPQETSESRQAEDREAALLFNTASRLYRQKTWRDAAAAFGDFLRRFPRHPDAAEAHFARGFCLNRLSQHAAAVQEFEAAEAGLAQSSGGRPAQSAWAAESFFYHGRSLEALALERPADSGERREGLRRAAQSYARAARTARTAGAARPKGEGTPPSGDGAGGQRKDAPPDLLALALTSQGEALYQAGSYAEAEGALAPLAEDAASFRGSAHLARGLYLLALARQAREEARGGDSGARALLERLSGPEFANDPVSEEAEFFLAGLLDRQGKRREAAERYAAVARRAGQHATEAAFYRAVSLYESRVKEDLSRAEEELGKFLERNSRHSLAPRARFYLALCQFDSGRYGEAAAKLREVAGGGGDLAGRAWLRLGQSLLLKEPPEPAQAAKALEEAQRALGDEKADARAGGASPAAAEALYWRGEALLAQGGTALEEAARIFADFHARWRQSAPELAEKALYQAARARFLQGARKQAAELSRRYRDLYAPETARFLLETLLVSAENAFRDAAGELPAEERAAAAGYYSRAAALAKDPAQARRLKYLSGVASYHQGERAAAARVLEEVAVENQAHPLPGFAEPDLPFYLANALAVPPASGTATPEELGRWKRAAALFARYLEAEAGGQHVPAALVNLGLCREWLGEVDEARKTFSTFLEKFGAHPRSPEVRFDLAGLQVRSGEIEPALAGYRRVAEEAREDSLSTRALLQVAILERRLKRPAAALEALSDLEAKRGRRQTGSAEDPLLPDAGFQRAMALSEAGKGREARLGLASYLEKFPAGTHSGEARVQLAHLLLDGNQPRKALEAIAPLIEEEPPRAERDQALYLRAWCFRQLRDGNPASGAGAGEASAGVDAGQSAREIEASYRRLIAEHPRSPFALDARVELAQQLFQEKAWPAARKCFEEAKEILDAAASAGESSARSRDLLERCTFGLGFLAFEEKRYDEARALLDRVVSREEGELAPRALFQAARAWMLSRGDQEAAQRFEKLLRDFRPRAKDLVEESYLRLGECYHRLSRYREAAEVLERMLGEFPQGALRHEGLFALGFALQFQDQTEKAAELYRKVVAGTQGVTAARAQYHIGECFMDRKKYREAAREFLTVPANFDFDGAYREWVRRALLGAGMAYQADGDKQAARAQYEELVKRFPETDEGRTAAQRLTEVKQ